MKLAISLAENQKYFTGTNPSVGCVITRNNKIISYSVTGKNGRPHAEINAINKKNLEIYIIHLYMCHSNHVVTMGKLHLVRIL